MFNLSFISIKMQQQLDNEQTYSHCRFICWGSCLLVLEQNFFVLQTLDALTLNSLFLLQSIQ